MKIKSIASLLAAALSASCLSGCALIVDGKTQPVAIKTNAPALYEVKNADGVVVSQGTAPTTVNLRRGDAPYTVTLRRSNESMPNTGTINDNLNGWLWGDVACGIIICGGVDLATGAAWDLDNEIKVDTVSNGHDSSGAQFQVPVLSTPTPITINNVQNNGKA
ncbi:hypothetical protein [Leclercia adecarboxylata]|uniref:hypothetical protein n=1 Tax=Leclercia adecarboxylata TaxID=83655 RepID=UPI0011C1C90C|nr:hypothetical protein [Leclercia adecarboxylata]MCU6675529.1 hypothetical protein [Leclercia adecarboxylata]MCV3305101.1 hypothetical protein [Leclercia adecarboxylata]MCV3309238.1 hypothetical protein [Leclercia adecarboxylata]